MNKKTFIIAEISANHRGNIDIAKKIIKAALESGADAVKLQTYTADTITLDCKADYFRIKGGTPWDSQYMHEVYQEAYTPWEWTPQLMSYANDLGLDCFSTPFDLTAVDFLEKCEVSRHKIASFELIDIPLLKKVAQTKKPIIMSTGMGTLAEIDEAVRTLRANGTTDLTLLKCTSSYPAPVEEANLLTIPHLATSFNCKVGLSDHTMGSACAVAAVALGASVIEKHFTLARADGGPDAAFSMEPHEFKQMVNDIRVVEKALGCVNYERSTKEESSALYRRSLFAIKDIEIGEVLTTENVRSIRPGHGLHTRYLEQILGRKARLKIKKGTPLSFNLI